jgi:hypothetical protein
VGIAQTLFEVEVIVETGNKEYKPLSWYGKAEWTRNKFRKMYHIYARNHSHAWKKAQKYGTPKSCYKVDVISGLANIENIKLDQEPMVGRLNPYPNAIAMDEMIWKKKKSKKYHNKGVKPIDNIE